jgi:hypothetical protein
MALTGASAAISALGTIAGGNAAEAAGKAANASAQFQAKQQEMAALESRATAQRAQFEKQRETQLVQSKLQARAASSGGGADDPTVLGLVGDIGARGEYESLMEMYKGENRARGLEDAAMSSRMSGEAALAEGQAKRKAASLSALGTIIGGAGSMFNIYNKQPLYRSGAYGYG